MHKLPLISIIIPTYNASNTLEVAIKSVLNQKYSNTELIIVDGNSNDSTLEIIKKYENKLVFISENDCGIYDAMNKGIDISSGDFIFFLGSDDELTESFSEFAQSIVNSNIIYYSNVIFKEINQIYDGAFSKFKILRRNISHQSILYPRKVFEKYRYELKYKVLADYMLNLFCFSDKNFKFKYVNLVVAKYSLNGFCGSGKNFDNMFYKDVPRIILNQYGILMFFYYLFSFRITWEVKNLIKKILR